MKRVLFATKNKGKIKEANEILQDFGYEVVAMQEAGIDLDIVEDGKTFEENALKKAVEIMKVSGEIAIADDSGLCVDALDGAPGIFSSRFAGENSTDEERNNKLLEMMKDIPAEKRGAKFVCVMAVAFPDGTGFTVRGECEGEILNEPRGSNGFGYDPLFYVAQHGMTTAEMDPSLKHSISHRGKAMDQMKVKMKELLGEG